MTANAPPGAATVPASAPACAPIASRAAPFVMIRCSYRHVPRDCHENLVQQPSDNFLIIPR